MTESKPIYAAAQQDDRCACCNRELYGHAIRMLELNHNTGLYSNGGIPPEESQGWFPFGLKCAKRVLANGGQTKTKR